MALPYMQRRLTVCWRRIVSARGEVHVEELSTDPKSVYATPECILSRKGRSSVLDCERAQVD